MRCSSVLHGLVTSVPEVAGILLVGMEMGMQWTIYLTVVTLAAKTLDLSVLSF